jgi:hypothetical protein
MSKRHQASRRKAYGRRQHEVHERVLRRVHDPLDVRVDHYGSESESDPLGYFDSDLGSPRFRFGLAD